MKVKLLKPFCSRKVGSIVTMHPANARVYFKEGVCIGTTDEDQAWLESTLVRRGKKVETQVESKVVETAVAEPTTAEHTKARKPRSPNKPKTAATRRKKS
jgi:hypothetical protein